MFFVDDIDLHSQEVCSQRYIFLNVLEMDLLKNVSSSSSLYWSLANWRQSKETHVATSHGDSLSLRSILKSNEKRI